MHPLAERILAGDAPALARGLRLVDDRSAGHQDLLRDLFPKTGRARIVGVTGNPGAGKSTLCDRLIEAFRKEGRRVGVLAVDPTSPFSGGAILGDRIRMQRHATDSGVFIRSVATRGHLGGLSRSARDMVRLMDAFGCDVVLVETVGVGQDELEITQTAHTTLVVVAPGMGDEVQAIKAGILECADVFAVNKADRDGADAAVRDLELMIALGKESLLSASKIRGHAVHGLSHGEDEARAHGVEASADAVGEGPFTPPIVRCVAVRGEGISEFVRGLDRHYLWATQTETGRARHAARARLELREALREALIEAALAELGPSLDAALSRVERREADPYTVTADLVRAFRGRP
ncbi:MAG: methylmalonyl Co-A mutase-associated GTPase MeaB [Myxococcales bacterium]|nr:methylmalonyl Co-A mutase-associated GTPase MeaB [Myxococcales bacterium]